MSGHLGNKEVMAENLKRYMNMYGLDRKDIAEIAGVSYFTVRDWLVARTYPRIDKIEILANHWNISKADLVEPESERPKPPTPIIEEITKISSQLEEPRQKLVLDTANSQLEEQKEEQKKKQVISLPNDDTSPLTEEELQEAVDQAVAFDGKPFDDREKEIVKQLLRQAWEEKHGQG
ncbi:helix-turn-helix transcriptional regulator [Lactococcus lactis]|uniref:Transcriptional regulator with XRE-family HTH domain n=1 Tax=Lactococcus lactis TaxID=1358 RepID=A0AAW5TJQ9_9LACT|nr:helix-turn-helix transcriptional regulator [Lactococcus lactis]MCW2281374.1 transcriptional regulator with XRE-family HTH domain [Lactococcus lactis]